MSAVKLKKVHYNRSKYTYSALILNTNFVIYPQNFILSSFRKIKEI